MDDKHLIETIRIQNGRVYNISYHNDRCMRSRQSLFENARLIDLRTYIDTNKAISIANSHLIKCRITYGESVLNVEYESYTPKSIRSLRLVEVGDFDYSLKYKDRDQLSSYYKNRGNADDILMTRDGFLTDSYYANVSLWDGKEWYTPKRPLLKGTRRASLLDKGRIVERDLHKEDIGSYKKASLFNAMIPLGAITIDTSDIL